MNYLAPLSAVADRLREQLPATLPVRTAIDLDQAQDSSVGSHPEVWVLFHRDTVDDNAGAVTSVVYQVAVLYVAPGPLADLERDGESLTAITKALAGYRPRGLPCAPFKRVGSLVPQSWEKAVLVAYGMLFQTTFTI